MGKTRTTQSSDTKESLNGVTSTKAVRVPALLRVFYIAENLLHNTESGLQLERFYHPGRCRPTLFITAGDDVILEVIEFNEPFRSWFVDKDEICANGRIYLTTRFDVTFFALYYLRKHCKEKAQLLDSISDEQDENASSLLSRFMRLADMNCVADIKTLKGSDDLVFYKYNPEKALAWLVVKTRRLADTLKIEGIYCGRSAVSQNYIRSEAAAEEMVHYSDYVRMAVEIVGRYIDLELYEELTVLLDIRTVSPPKIEEKKPATKKRKSETLQSDESKKPKLEEQQNCDLLNDSLDDENKEIKAVQLSKATPLKERTLTTKQKALAKVAKGSKSIASFFKK